MAPHAEPGDHHERRSRHTRHLGIRQRDQRDAAPRSARHRRHAFRFGVLHEPICAPSRAAILTGIYNHVNGVTTLDTRLDNTLRTLPQQLQNGWQTAMFGKWHLGHDDAHDPTGFDSWRILPGQGHYHDPVFIDSKAGIVERSGYVTDLIPDDCLDWLDRRDTDRPFALFCHHKAPHRTWEPDAKHFTMYDDAEIQYPDTFRDDLAGRAEVVQAVRMRMLDLDPAVDLKATVPSGLTLDEEIDWRYQRYIEDYLRVVASIDDNVGRKVGDSANARSGPP